MNRLAFTDTTDEDKTFFNERFGQINDVEALFFENKLEDEIDSIPADISVLCVSHQSPVTTEQMDRFGQLKLIATRSTGFNHVDIRHAKNSSIAVTNVPTYGENTVAEYTFAILLALMRKLAKSLEQIDSGRIDYQELRGQDLNGLTFGIIGAGRIGRHVARIARGFEMQIVGFDPFPDYEEAEKLGLEYMDFDSVLRLADVVSLHAPLTEHNRHMINSHTLGMMKPTAVLVNTARGELVKTDDLMNALIDGVIAGAAIDVVDGEDVLEFDDEIELFHKQHDRQKLEMALEHEMLEKMDNVVFTPHNAFNTAGALARIRQTTADNIQAFLNGDPINLVN